MLWNAPVVRLTIGRICRLRRCVALCGILVAYGILASGAYAREAEKRYDFHIEETALGPAINAFVRLTDKNILFPYELADETGLNPVIGRYTIEEALEILLRNTEFSGGLSDNGVLFIARSEPTKTEDREDQMTSGKLKRGLLASIAAFVFGAGASIESAAADQDTSAAAGDLDEITVYGEKLERSLQDTVSSVAVIGEAQIRESTILDLDDILLRVANVTLGSGGEGFSIRGMNYSGLDGGATSVDIANAGLATLVFDDATMTEEAIQVGQAELWDIAQVEVFRGPQSFNQGRSSLAGAIVIRSVDPGYERDIRYRALIGERGTRGVSVAYGDALISDQLAFRFAVDYQTTDGYITNPLQPADSDDEYGFSKNLLYRGKLLFEPEFIEGLSLLLTVSRSENEEGDFLVSTIDENRDPIDPFRRLNFSNIDAFENHDQTIITLRGDYELNDAWGITSITSWNDSNYDRQDDGDNQARGGDATRIQRQDAKTLSQELRVLFNYDALSGYLGAYYYKKDATKQSRFGSPETIRPVLPFLIAQFFPESAPVANDIALLYDDPFLFSGDIDVFDNQIENWAFYGEINYEISSLISVFAGLRYDNESQFNDQDDRISILSPFPDIAALPPALVPHAGTVAGVNFLLASQATSTAVMTDATYDAFLPKAGITLNWTEDVATSFSVQRGYRAGGSGVSGTGPFEFDPEFTTNYELSFRSQWFDRRLTVNANLFYIDWTDQQVVIVDPFLMRDFTIENAASSSLHGVELDVTAHPTDRITIYANLGITKTEYDDFVSGEENFAGNQFIRAPEFNTAAGIVFRITDRLRWQADVSYEEESFDNAANTFQTDAYTLVNSKIAYHVNDHVLVSLSGRNLLDEDFIRASDVGNDFVVRVSEPRTVFFQIEGSF